MVSTDAAKSCLPEQQMQFSVDSQTESSSVWERTLASMSAWPYSFSYTTKSRPVRRASSWMNVVFPAPRKPDTTSTRISLPSHRQKSGRGPRSTPARNPQ